MGAQAKGSFESMSIAQNETFMSRTRDECLYMAHLAEQAERYADMCVYIGRAAQLGPDLSESERDKFQRAYKKTLQPRRQQWMQVQEALNNETRPPVRDALTAYREKAATEIS